MAGQPPPKEGEVTVSSTRLWQWFKALLHGDTKQQWDAAKDIKSALKDGGYADGE